jgi:pimeloyl-ACP methyl ester carboxylesterase
VEAPDLNRPSFEKLEFGAIADAAESAARDHPPAAVVGSSLGALVALELARRGVTASLVLVAPALGFGRRWTEKLPAGDPVPFFHYAEERELPIHRAFFEQMSALTVDREPPAVPVTILMGRKDESVPFELVEKSWNRWACTGRLPPGSQFIEIPEGDHGLLDFADLIAAEVRKAAGIEPHLTP